MFYRTLREIFTSDKNSCTRRASFFVGFSRQYLGNVRKANRDENNTDIILALLITVLYLVWLDQLCVQ